MQRKPNREAEVEVVDVAEVVDVDVAEVVDVHVAEDVAEGDRAEQ